MARAARTEFRVLRRSEPELHARIGALARGAERLVVEHMLERPSPRREDVRRHDFIDVDATVSRHPHTSGAPLPRDHVVRLRRPVARHTRFAPRP